MKLQDLDPWQKEVVDTILLGEQNVCIRSGRQCGKSACISVAVAEFAVLSKVKGDVIVISHTEKQAYLLFSKIRDYLLDNHVKLIKKPHTRNITKSEIHLINGIVIRCLPCGTDGTTLRGYTAILLVADEAAHMATAIFDSVIPTLSTSSGKIVLLSTPLGIDNYFYHSYHNPSFKTWHVSSEDCPRISKEFLEEQKRTRSKVVYNQEYKAEFTDMLRQMFSDALIRSCMTEERNESRKGVFCMGNDIALMGGDEFTCEIGRYSNGIIYHAENWVTDAILAPDLINKIKEFDKIYDFKKIYLDTGGIGAPIFQFLLRDMQTRRKVVDIDNARRPVERDRQNKEGRKAKLMKEHLYQNLKVLMEQGKIKLLKDSDIFYSLKSIQQEVTDSGEVRISGSYSHIAEGLIRMAWYAQEKNLNISFAVC